MNEGLWLHDALEDDPELRDRLHARLVAAADREGIL